MDDPQFEQEYNYEEYPDVGVTSVGLPPSQLALIIGVNAVISLVISIAVVLLANRQAPVTGIAMPTDAIQAEALPAESMPPTVAAEEILPPGTPVQSAVYVVEAGDTLGLIAEKFSVPLTDLMIANGLTNKDFIQIGQELTIPLQGIAAITPTFTPILVASETPLPFDPPTPLPADAEVPPEPAVTVGPSPTPSITPTATPSPIPTSTPPSFDEINISISEVVGGGDLARETLVILNKGAGVSLKEWRLEGSALGVFILPDIFLFSGGSIRVNTAAGQNTPSDLFLSQGEAAWPPGTEITLSDASSTPIDSLAAP